MKREIEERSRKEALSKAKFEAAHFKQKYELLRTQTLSARMNSSTVPSLRNYRTLSHTMSMNNQLYVKTKMPQCNQLSNSVMNFPAKVIVLGEGVFGKVSVAEFKTLDISVAVKSGKSCYFSAAFEARVLQCLNGHQCFPYVFGIYKNNLVMECLAVMSKDGYYVHTVSKQLESFYKRLRNKAVKTNEETNEETNELTLSEKNWFSICYKVTDAIRYMHSRSILHNDIKGDNVIISTCKQSVFIPKVCDFGKATHLQNPKVYSLTEKEMITYNTRHRHLAHELRNVKGSCQSPLTDTYSLGYMFKTIAHFRQIALLKPIAHGMKDHNSKKRTLLSGVLEELKKLVN